MKFSAAFSLLFSAAFFGLVSAHSREWSLYVDGVDQGEGQGKYLRQPPSNSPVKDLTSNDLFCNVGGTTAVSGSVSIAAGSTFTSEWFHDNRGDDIIDGSHVGPIVVYLAPRDVAPGEASWVKIFEDGFDGSQWAIIKMKNNGGKFDFQIPSTLAAGDYLMRIELVTLHEADTLFTANAARGVQLYPSCNQITVTGSGSVTLPSGVAFPGVYTDSEPGILFNIYNTAATQYVIPGPAVWDGQTGGSAPAPAPSATVPTEEKPVETTVEAPAETTVEAPVETTTAVPTTVVSPPAETSLAAPTTTQAPAVTTTQVAVPVPTGKLADANECMRYYNKCLDATQPKPDWNGCGATRDVCLQTATYNYNMNRIKRDGKFGRLL